MDNADAGPQPYLLSLNFKQRYYTTTLIVRKLATEIGYLNTPDLSSFFAKILVIPTSRVWEIHLSSAVLVAQLAPGLT